MRDCALDSGLDAEPGKRYKQRMLRLLLLLAGAAVAASAQNSDSTPFQRLGAPVTKAMLMATAVGPDSTGEREWIYFDFAQTGATLFLVAVDPDTGEARQFKSPVGPGAWALIRGPDEKMYLGTWESGYILKFDPLAAEKGIQVIGKPSQTETYIWQYAIGKNGKLYGCTYGNAKLVSYDPKSGQMEDLGRMDDTQMYTRSIACGPEGKIYTGIGYGRANVVVFDPQTGQHRSILPEQYKTETAASVHLGTDGKVYAHCGKQGFRIDDEKMMEISPEQVRAAPGLRLRDGRTITVGEVSASTVAFTLTDATGKAVERSFKYSGDGALLFTLAPGPENRIYGSTAMPLEMFSYDPAANKSAHLGNPTTVNGEIYSFSLWSNKLFLCAYPGSYLSLYDPSKPFKFGTNAGSNPRGYGNLGDGHLRPRAMIFGPDEKLYIGSLPPYGELGGALAVFDPMTWRVTANYRNLITNQSIVSLVYDPKTKLIYGGSSIAGGGGTRPSEKEARFFAFDPVTGAKVFEQPLLPGAAGYSALCLADKHVVAATGNRLLLYDPENKSVARQIQLSGTVLDLSLALQDGLIWGLTSNSIFAADPQTGRVAHIFKTPVPVHCGFALVQDQIYFGSGPDLWRFTLPKQSAPGS